MKNNITQQNIPIGWKQVALGDLVSVTTGKRDANHGSPDGQYPFFTCAQKVSKIDNYAFDTEAVLIAGNGDFNVKYYKGKFDAYQRTYVLSGFKGTTGSFVYQKAKQALNEIIKNNQGSSVKFIKMGDLTDYHLLLPPIKEQQKIAEILETVDEDIAKTREVIEATEKLKRGLMQQLFTRGIGHTKFKETKVGQIPEEWEIGGFKNLVNSDDKNAIKPGPFGSALKKGFYVEKGFKIYGQEQVISGDAFYGNYYVNEEKYNELEGFKVNAGDILISLVGTIGKILIVPENFEKGIINPRLLKITPDRTKADSQFIAHLLKSDFLIQQMGQKSHGGTMSILNKGMLMSVGFGVPPLKEQKDIAEILSAVDLKISVNKKLNEKITVLKKGLMQDLLSGKVRTINI